MVNKLPPPRLQLKRSCLSISTAYEEYSSSLLSLPPPSRLLFSLFPPDRLQDENQKRIEYLVKEILGLGCLEGPGADNIFRDGSELVQDGNVH